MKAVESTTMGVAFAVAAVMLAVAPATGWADDTPEIDTVVEDYEFGDHDLPAEAKFSAPRQERGLADLRGRFDPLAEHTIGWTSGYIPPAGSVTITNRLIYGQRLSVSAAEGFQLFGEAYLPLGAQTYAGGGTQLYVASGEAWNLTVGAQGRYRRTNFRPGTADAGGVVHAVFDAIATDNTTWNIGVAAHIPVYRAVEQVAFDECDHRRQWAESACGITEQTEQFLPPSGWWGALFGGINYFVYDWLILNVEAFTGISQGNFWALQSALNPELAYDDERQVVEQTDFTPGLGPLGVFTLGLGSTWRVAGLGVQPSLYFANYQGDAQILPWVSAAFRFGGG